MAKMYYTEQEAAAKLHMSPAELADLVRQRKLQAYADGANRMYKVADVDAMAQADLKAESDIQLTPADTGDTGFGGEDSRAGTRTGKSDTVITSEGISIFDDEDLEIETADPMAKTQIAPSLEDQITLEGVGSGSGLLDLTRESDDTSLGAEVLDHIDVESEMPAAEALAASVAAPEPAETPMVMETTAPVRVDPMAGLFGGLMGAAALLMLLAGAVGLGVMFDKSPSWVQTLGGQLPIVLGASALVAIIAAVIGYFVGKNVSDRAAAAAGR